MGTPSALSLATGAIDPALSRLFSSSLSTAIPKTRESGPPKKKAKIELNEEAAEVSTGSGDSISSQEDFSSGSEDSSSEASVVSSKASPVEGSEHREPNVSSFKQSLEELSSSEIKSEQVPRKKRKRANEHVEIEDVYLEKLSRIQEKQSSNRTHKDYNQNGSSDDELPGSRHVSLEADGDESDYEIPQHETQDNGPANGELERASRTVFLGNVSSETIKSKEAMKQLTVHLTSFFPQLPQQKDGKVHKIESFRFRSVAFSTTSIPRKAAFAKRELMDATTRSTNAYVVYSTAAATREAVRRLNGSVVLGRHLRVDGVAHPSPVDHRRCVFVGNLGFVDDESLIQAAENEEEDDDSSSEKPKKKKNNKKKPTSDVEEGLWRTFGKAGTVESVRVVRDKTTRVGKGIAYVQFTDQVAVEKALQFDGKAFPPLLPRPLRVTRAKKPSKTATALNRQKEQAAASLKAADTKKGAGGKVYNPKVDPNVSTVTGRAGKLLGRAGAAQTKDGASGRFGANGIRRPEDFVFEGHRAKATEGKGTMNLKPVKSGKKKASKPTSRSSRRGAAFKAAGKKN